MCRRPRLVLALSVLACIASLYAACTRLEYHTQRTDLISPHKDYQQRWQRYLGEFGDDDDIVVVVQGTDRKRMERALDTLAGRVGTQPRLFDRLFYKVNLQSLHDRALLFLPVAEIESRYVQGVLPRGDNRPQRCSEATTSSAFIVLPSWNGTPLRSLMT